LWPAPAWWRTPRWTADADTILVELRWIESESPHAGTLAIFSPTENLQDHFSASAAVWSTLTCMTRPYKYWVAPRRGDEGRYPAARIHSLAFGTITYRDVSSPEPSGKALWFVAVWGCCRSCLAPRLVVPRRSDCYSEQSPYIRVPLVERATAR
jgi:hypothetical protein